MANISYTALRSIIAGHSSGVGYDFDFTIGSRQRTPSVKNSVKRAIDGSMRTVNYSFDEEYSITTDFILNTTTTWDQWEEFLASVRNGESFDIDIKGTNASPVNPITVKMNGNPSYNSSSDGRLEGYESISFNFIYNENF